MTLAIREGIARCSARRSSMRWLQRAPGHGRGDPLKFRTGEQRLAGYPSADKQIAQKTTDRFGGGLLKVTISDGLNIRGQQRCQTGGHE